MKYLIVFCTGLLIGLVTTTWLYLPIAGVVVYFGWRVNRLEDELDQTYANLLKAEQNYSTLINATNSWSNLIIPPHKQTYP